MHTQRIRRERQADTHTHTQHTHTQPTVAVVLSVSALRTVKETVVCVPVRDVPGLTASVELTASVRKSAVLAVKGHVNVLTATVAPTVNVVPNVKEEQQAAVSVCVRDVMVLRASVGTSASVLTDAANALNAVSSLPSVY